MSKPNQIQIQYYRDSKATNDYYYTLSIELPYRNKYLSFFKQIYSHEFFSDYMIKLCFVTSSGSRNNSSTLVRKIWNEFKTFESMVSKRFDSALIISPEDKEHKTDTEKSERVQWCYCELPIISFQTLIICILFAAPPDQIRWVFCFILFDFVRNDLCQWQFSEFCQSWQYTASIG